MRNALSTIIVMLAMFITGTSTIGVIPSYNANGARYSYGYSGDVGNNTFSNKVGSVIDELQCGFVYVLFQLLWSP